MLGVSEEHEFTFIHSRQIPQNIEEIYLIS